MADAYFLHYAPHGDFEQGIFAPYNTLEEAEMQAAWDLYGQPTLSPDGKTLYGAGGLDPEMLLGIFRAPYDPPRRALTRGEIANLTVTHLDKDYREKQRSRSEIEKNVAKLVKPLLEEQERQLAAWLLDIDQAIKRGHSPHSNAVPGNAYTWCTGGTATGSAFAPSTTIKTVLLLLAGAANQPAITEIAVSFDGVTASAVPCLVELYTSTNTTAGTPRATLASGKQIRGWPAQTSVTTCGDSYTAEPTTKSVAKKWLVSPNGGLFVMQNPLGREPTGLATAATDGKQYGLQVTCPAAVNVHAYFELEE